VGRVFLTLTVLVVFAGLATSAYLLKTYLGRDGRFRIGGAGNIEVSGLTEVSRAEMLPVFGEDIGRNIFFVPLSERRKQLEQIPWIETATVMRLLPDEIRVSVVERQPVAFTRMGSHIGLVDANGVLLTMPAAMMAQHHYSFPVVTGINPSDPLAARQARMAVYQRLLAELDANGQHISQQISEIDLSDPEDARVLMPEQGADILAHFGSDRFLDRYQRYKTHIAEWRQQYPRLAAVDLRYDQQVVLQMASASNDAQPASGDADSPNASATTSAASNAVPEPDKSAAVKPIQVAHAASTHPAPVNLSGKVKPMRTAGKAQGKSSAKSKKAGKSPLKAAQSLKEKKRAVAKRAALNATRQRSAPTATPASSAGMGQ
jgi:cell division protein FtsQ